MTLADTLLQLAAAAVCKVYGHGSPQGPFTCPKCRKVFRSQAANGDGR